MRATGCAVLVILALTGGVPALARACLSAWLATVLTGLALIAQAPPPSMTRSSPCHPRSLRRACCCLPRPADRLLALLRDRQPAQPDVPGPRRLQPAVPQPWRSHSSLALPSPARSPRCRRQVRRRPGTARRPTPQILTQSAAEHVAGAVSPYLGAAWIPGSFPAPAPARG